MTGGAERAGSFAIGDRPDVHTAGKETE
jgi:hypothetical protein